MELADLVKVLPGAEVRGDTTIAVSDVAHDSRAVARGSLYLCVPGEHADGHDFAGDAVARGAAALLVERWVDADRPQVRVPSVRAAVGPVAAALFGHPSRAMTVVGVTGTNGKTTTAFLLERALVAAGMTAGLIGTVEVHVAGTVLPVVHTTPEATDLQRLLARMRDAGVDGVAMEVSSHGLALRRVDATRFACGVFTNLSRDHLDFHGTMDAYEAAKARLFDGEMAERGAINADDAAGRRLIEDARIPVTSFGVSPDADVRATDVETTPAGSGFVCLAGGERFRVQLRLTGRYNVFNALAVLAACRALDVPLAAAVEGIGTLDGVPGRLEAIDAGQDFAVLVDYAHTPDSLENVLRAAREVCDARLVVVFGCGGDRDRGKRPLMGRVGATMADRVIITSDNPRSEEPLAIIAGIEAGARETKTLYEVEPDRRAAIRRALEGAGAGDVVLIAGKGHETGQRFADRTVPFDDRSVAREELLALGGGR